MSCNDLVRYLVEASVTRFEPSCMSGGMVVFLNAWCFESIFSFSFVICSCVERFVSYFLNLSSRGLYFIYLGLKRVTVPLLVDRCFLSVTAEVFNVSKSQASVRRFLV